MSHRLSFLRAAAVFAATVALTVTASAQVPPKHDPAIAALGVRHPDLGVFHDYKPSRDVSPILGARLEAELAALGVSRTAGYYDLRGGRWGSLILSRPLIPGQGVGNSLQWTGGAPADESALKAAAWSAFRDYLAANQAQLKVDPAELGTPRITVHEGGRIIQMNARRSLSGIEARDSIVMGVVNSGNLILYATRNWGSGPVATNPAIPQDAAAAVVAGHTAPVPGAALGEPRLSVITLENGGHDVLAIAVGNGYRQRLVWVVDVRLPGDQGSWEALVDAQDGALLSFADRNSYADTQVTGGVLPVSNDGLAPNGIPDGVEQTAWPMPFADLSDPSGSTIFTNSGGLAKGAPAGVTTKLSGPFVKMSDGCGPIAETAATCGPLDLGSGTGTDCLVPVPGVSSPGNTRSSRTGFYEVNRIKEMARGWLPENAWLQGQLTSTMNIDNACNAFWNGSTINFYRATPETSTAGTQCRNTGEIAAVFDHEWGHGMDNFDAVPDISLPGEATADMYAMVRLNSSCIGRGFYRKNSLGGQCGGNGDPCTDCSGVRDADWAKRRSGLPHDIAWILRPTVTPGVAGVSAGGGCVGSAAAIPVLQTGPCLQGTHCEGNVTSEAVWDLISRDLAAAPFNYDRSTALNLVSRLHYLGGGNVNFWYQCNPTGTGGCNADGGYLNYLAIDDDNGNLEDGTPHMTAIHAAFGRHQMACGLMTPVNSGCTGTPAAPQVTATAITDGVDLSWSAVGGASKYWVFRSDGIHGCEFGKERIGIVTGTSFRDTAVMPGRTYYYALEAVGSGESCRSTASACASAVPLAAASNGPSLVARPRPGSLAIASGDGDEFVDNCETASIGFEIENTGGVSLTNVLLASVQASNADTKVTTALPMLLASSLPAACGAKATGDFAFAGGGLGHDETLTFTVSITANELPAPVFGTLTVSGAESDFTFTPSATYSFEEGYEGWRVVSGTFIRQGPIGANATLTHLASSALVPAACDRIQSPEVKLTATSSLSLSNQYATEPGTSETGFYDRANVGLFDVSTAARDTISPDGGRAYEASGPNGNCVTEGQPGWAGAGPGFLPSTWSAAALGADSRAGRRVRLDVAYGTDPIAEASGFQFDEVVVTDAFLQTADTQANSCTPAGGACGPVGDGSEAVSYDGGWHLREAALASGGSFHRRVGTNKKPATARFGFSGDSVVYHYVMSDIGGSADIYIDGVLKETLSYGTPAKGKENPTFGHSRTYSSLGSGPHVLEIRHRSGAVYVDGFEVPCATGAGASSTSGSTGSVTEVQSVAAAAAAVVQRTVTVGAADTALSVVVEGANSALSLTLLDATGVSLATGTALVSGLPLSGLDAQGLAAGTYTVRVVNGLTPATVEISTARTVKR